MTFGGLEKIIKMKKYLFVIARYNDGRQQIFDDIISPRNQKYADKHGFKYVEIKNEHTLTPFRGNPTWWKFTVLRDLINSGHLETGDIVSHMDADMYIVNDDFDLVPRDGKSFAYSIDSGNTHCMGWYSIRINDWSKKLVDNILSEDRFNKLKDKITIHDRFKTYSSFWNEFREQASWYSLAGVKRHSDVPFWLLDNNGFHSAKDEHTVYSVDELNAHVDLYPTGYNVTEWEGESSGQFNINPVYEDEVYIRHFAGGQDWNLINNWIK